MTPNPAVLDVDAMVRENAPPPMSIRLGGVDYTLIDIQELDYRTIKSAQVESSTGDLTPIVKLILDEKDHNAFFANKLTSQVLEALFTKYNAHFGINPGTPV